jgi:hypothetical protein
MEIMASYIFGQELLTILEVALLVFWITTGIPAVAFFRSLELSGSANASWIFADRRDPAAERRGAPDRARTQADRIRGW